MSDEVPVPEAFEEKTVIDQRLLERVLKRMKALVKGNGLDPEQVSLADEIEVLQYRFSAKTEVKLVPKYGIRMEPGKNTRAELAVSIEDFQKKIQSAVSDVQLLPEKRQKVTDFIFSRSDKGFSIKEQAVTFRDLTFDLVRHEQCQFCSRSGKVSCPNCKGRGMLPCTHCRGAKAVTCPKCGGSARMQTPQGHAPCDQCRGTGKIQCSWCHGKGQVKCRTCAASGQIACEKCAGTGWLSHLAHIEIEGQIRFGFDREKLPQRLSVLIADRGSFLVSKGDIEVQIVTPSPTFPSSAPNLSDNKVKEASPDLGDVIVTDYDATCPYGPIRFHLGDREVPALLLGWQGRIIESPAFLEDLTKVGMQAIEAAANGQGDAATLLRRAAGFSVWHGVLSQLITSGNFRKAVEVTLNRYPTGLDKKKLQEMVVLADRAIRAVTRKARYVGFGFGMTLFAGLTTLYFGTAVRGVLTGSIPSALEPIPDLLLIPAGILLGIMGGWMMAAFSQRKAFSGVVPDDVLKRAPRMGGIIWWSLGGAVFVFLAVLVGLDLSGQPLPDWISRWMPF